MRQILIIVVPLLFVANLAVTGDSRDRTIAAMLALLIGAIVAAEVWATRHPEHVVSRRLYAPRLVPVGRVGLIAMTLLGLYVGIIAVADRFSLLDSAVVMTIAFFAMFLGLIAIAAVIDRGVRRLRRKRE